MSRLAVAALTCILAVASAGCTPDPAARVDRIQELRDELAAPASALGTAALGVEEAVRRLRTDELSPEDRLALATAITEDALAELTRARDAAAAVVIEPDTGDARAASEAWAAANAASARLGAAARAEVETVRALARAHRAIASVIAAWDEPGQYSTQLIRLAEEADRARSVARRLRSVEDPVRCSSVVGDTRRAATAVALATTELRDLVVARSGEGFDDRRRELRRDPLGTGQDLEDLVVDAACWTDASKVAELADLVRDHLSSLEAVLDPQDL